MRRPMASRNKRPAIKAVATLSKFNKSEAVEAGVVCKPTSNTMGAMMPPKATAPSSQGKSWKLNLASGACP